MLDKKKQTNQNRLLLLGVILSLLMTACQPVEQAEKENNQLIVTVSILPQAYFVERIGGEQVAVNVMVGPGEEAHTYEPKPDQMKKLSDSQVFFSIGIEYEESWIPRFEDINPDLWIVDSAAGIERIPMTVEHSHDEEESPATDEARLDPHVWLSPENGKTIAFNILTALQELAPDQKTNFQENYHDLITEIDALDEHINTILSNLEQRTFMVFHPAWGYFAEQYDLKQLAVQIGGQDPSASELAELIATAKNEGIQVIFVQPSFSTTSAQAITNEINGEVAIVDPLAKDWLANLASAAEAFAAAMGNNQLY